MKSASRVAKAAPGSATASVTLVEAWKRLSTGHASVDDFEIAMADLAAYSGVFAVTPFDASDAELRHREGRRDLMARILFLVGLSSEAMTALREAAAQERGIE